MNQYFEEAESLVKELIKDLERLLPRDGEDISCYSDRYMDELIMKAIRIKILMTLGVETE